ncbi:helix-turn-helix transcriptional regulator [Paenibacillus rhizoplanae]
MGNEGFIACTDAGAASRIKKCLFQYSRMNIERLERGGERTVYEWHRQIQTIVDDMDQSIKQHNSEAITLQSLADKLGYSEFHTTRKFKEISGMQLRDYLRHRKLAFALKEVRDSGKSILDIALDYGFSSHEAFYTRIQGDLWCGPKRVPETPVSCRPSYQKSTRLTATFFSD